MQQKRDDLDYVIYDSFKQFEVSEDYNYKLLEKVKKAGQNSETSSFKMRTAAASLILSGLILALLSFPGVQCKIINMQNKIKSTEAFINFSKSENIVKYIYGE